MSLGSCFTASSSIGSARREHRISSGDFCTTSQTNYLPRNKILIFGRNCSSQIGPSYNCLQHVRHTRSDSPIARMGIKWIESFESKAEIPEEKKLDLEELLKNATFCKQVAAETKQAHDSQLEYTGMIFQPVPWSPATPKGMPGDYEEYHNNPDYVTINVPPNFLFQSKIFQPSRLCAIYRKQQ